MKNLETRVFKVNGFFDRYANENTKRKQSFSSLAKEMGRNWDEMTKRQRQNFRKRHANKLKEIPTKIEIYEVKAFNVPNIFSDFQLREAAIDKLIFELPTLFLRCKTVDKGYCTSNFEINKIQ